MANLADVDIRIGIKTSIETALSNLYGGEPDVRILTALNTNVIGKNLAALKSLEGDDIYKVNGWVISSASISRSRPDSKDGFNKGSLRYSGPGRRDIIKKYKIACFKELDFGTEDEEEYDNSEIKLITEIDAVSDYFSKNPQLGIKNDLFLGHEELQFQNIGVFNNGEVICNVAQGTLTVHYFQLI